MSKKKASPLLSILVPCFNEQETIETFIKQIFPVLEDLSCDHEIIFIDDGSEDGTLLLLTRLCEKYPVIKAIALSRHFGKEAALTAGLDLVEGDAVIPIDVDGQDPVDLIPKMVAKWQSGAEVVLAKRIDRRAESLFRRYTARGFYKLIAYLSASPIPRDVGDYRLMDKVVVAAIRQLPEKNRFMKGLLSWPGYSTEVVEYSRPERTSGRSKWRVWRLFNHALDGIFSFSTAPLRMWTYIGLILSFFSLMYLLYIVFKTLIFGIDLPGYASILSIILFFSGINLIGLGILGEYLGRVFIEVKQRPVYLVKSKIGF